MAFKAEDFISDLLSQPNYLPQDSFIDTSGFKEAKNVIEFLTSDVFIGNMLPSGLFPRQMELLIKLNSEYCPYCSDMEFFGSCLESKFLVNEKASVILDKVQLLEYGICPKCKARKSEMYRNGDIYPHTEFVGLLGQRSGKSATSSMQLSYSTHKFLMVPNLQRTYNLLPSSPFIMPLVGLSFSRAQETLYNAYFEYITKGNWFKAYIDFVNNEGNRQDFGDLIVVKDTFTRFRHKNILVAPFGPDKRKLRGNTSIASATDEVGWFIQGGTDGIKFDADEIYASVNNSLMTAKEAFLRLVKEGYDNLPAPININISSPSSKKDKICRLYEESKYDPFMYGIHLATWEVNPYLPLDGPTMTNLRKKNERNFWRDFGAVPPNSSNAFFSSPELFEETFSGNNICKIKKEHHFLRDQEFTYGKLIVPKAELQKPNRILALDAGFKNNSFAFAVAHLEDKNDLRIPVFDALVEIIPEDTAPLNYSKIYEEVINPMIEQLNIRLVCTDRWQNIKLLSDIENDKKLKCQTKQYSVKYGDFLNFRQAVYDRNVKFPRPELPINDIERAGNDSYPNGFEGNPVSHFIFQAITVVDMMGKTVSKGDGVTDDIFRAAVLAYSIILNDDYKNLFKGFQRGYGGTNRGIGANPSGMGQGTGSRIGAMPTNGFNPYR